MYRLTHITLFLFVCFNGLAQIKTNTSFQRVTDNACNTRYFFKYYRAPVHAVYFDDMITLPGGDLVLCGSGRNFAANSSSFIMRTDKNGIPLWDITIDVNATTSNGCMDVQLLSDGNLLALGFTSEGGILSHYLLKITPAGNILWRKDFRIGNAIIFNKSIIKEDADGSILMTGNFLETFSFTDRVYLLKFTNTGDLLFNHIYYRTPTISVLYTNDLLIQGDYVYIVGGHITSSFRGLLLKINKNDGTLAWSRTYDYNSGDAFFSQIFPYSNDRLCIIGSDNINETDSSLVMVTDLDGNVGSAFFSVYNSGHERGKATMNASGQLLWASYLRDDPTFSTYMTLSLINPLTGTQWVKNYPDIQDFPRPQKLLFDSDNTLLMAGYSNSPTALQAYLGRFSPSGDYGCVPELIPFTTGPVTVQSQLQNFIRTPITVTALTRNAILTPPVISEIDSICYLQFNCDTLFLSQPQPVCDLSATITISVGLSPGCTIAPSFQYDNTHLALQSFTGSIATFSILREGQSQVNVTLNTNCEVLKDSVNILTFNNPALHLGADTTICPGNTITLNAGAGFQSYQWQDGSVDSTLLVQAPGTYYINVQNYCGETFSDTIIVSPASPPFLDAGPDRVKCNNDTIHIVATSGFLNYSWAPAYNINTTTGQQVIVNPSVDTMYTLIAEKTLGCFAFDTVNITVLRSPLINLGNDLSFCRGDSVVLNAGIGFNSYQWNNGSSSQQFTAYTQGNYSVIATDANGCKSFDTLKVINVFSNPVISINPDSTLCSGQVRSLDAGSGFQAYNWNNGSNTQTISVTQPGVYAIQVTDQNGCKGTDTTVINTIFPLPENFLPPDTTICSYGNLILKPGSSFKNYNWNTGSTQPSLTITNPGTYWLRVTDNNGCVNTDTIQVLLKDCLTGFYIPSAFTPDNNGKNDIFRPLIFGNVKHYLFNIYNRWGQLVFSTNRLDQGWNGSYNGTPQDGNVFVWYCIYQFEGGEKKLEKGLVTLFR